MFLKLQTHTQTNIQTNKQTNRQTDAIQFYGNHTVVGRIIKIEFITKTFFLLDSYNEGSPTSTLVLVLDLAVTP